MELEQFIEQNIKAFLDKRQQVSAKHSLKGVGNPNKGDSKTVVTQTITESGQEHLTPEEVAIYTPSRQYADELDSAIHSEEFEKAKQILLDLKEEHDKYPRDAPEWTVTKELFKELYQRFKDSFRHDIPSDFIDIPFPEVPSLDEQLVGASDSQGASAREDSVIEESLSHESAQEVIQEQINASTKGSTRGSAGVSVKEKDSIQQHLKKSESKSESKESKLQILEPAEENQALSRIEHLQLLITEKKYDEAISIYTSIRKVLLSKSLSKEQERRLVIRAHTIYQRLKNELRENEVGAGMDSKERGERDRDEMRNLLKRYEYHLRAANTALSAEEFDEALIQYHILRDLHKKLPAEKRDESHEVLKRLYHALKDTLKVTGKKDRVESSKIPSNSDHRRQPTILERAEQRLNGTP